MEGNETNGFHTTLHLLTLHALPSLLIYQTYQGCAKSKFKKRKAEGQIWWNSAQKRNGGRNSAHPWNIPTDCLQLLTLTGNILGRQNICCSSRRIHPNNDANFRELHIVKRFKLIINSSSYTHNVDFNVQLSLELLNYLLETVKYKNSRMVKNIKNPK
jgi:hypothetical protein